MRAQHTAHPLPTFPVYSAAFLSPTELVLGAGGGASKSGVKNKLRVYNVPNHKELEMVAEYELGQEEDAPMSMAAHPESKAFVCGINSTPAKMEKGENENCRVFKADSNKLVPVGTRATLGNQDLEDYQKVTVLSADGKSLAVAGKHSVSLLSFPSLSPLSPSVNPERGEIYDAVFRASSPENSVPSHLFVATTSNIYAYILPHTSLKDIKKGKNVNGKISKKSKGKQTQTQTQTPLELLATIPPPTLPGVEDGAKVDFRAIRFRPSKPNAMYTAINTAPGPNSRRRGGKTAARQGFVARWSEGASGWTTTSIRKVGNKGVTCFDVSPNGKWLAYGSSDCSVGVLDAQTLAPLLTILKAHEFPPTVVKFNPASSLLVSGSVDNSVRVISLPGSLGEQAWTTTIIVLLTILAIVLAIVFQMAMLR